MGSRLRKILSTAHCIEKKYEKTSKKAPKRKEDMQSLVAYKGNVFR